MLALAPIPRKRGSGGETEGGGTTKRAKSNWHASRGGETKEDEEFYNKVQHAVQAVEVRRGPQKKPEV